MMSVLFVDTKKIIKVFNTPRPGLIAAANLSDDLTRRANNGRREN